MCADDDIGYPMRLIVWMVFQGNGHSQGTDMLLCCDYGKCRNKLYIHCTESQDVYVSIATTPTNHFMSCECPNLRNCNSKLFFLFTMFTGVHGKNGRCATIGLLHSTGVMGRQFLYDLSGS